MGCFDEFGNPDIIRYRSTKPHRMAKYAPNVAHFFLEWQDDNWRGLNFRQQVAYEWDINLAIPVNWDAHHLLSQFLVTGANKASDEHYEEYQALYMCPLLAVPLSTEMHIGRGGVHTGYRAAARDMDVDLSEGLYKCLAGLSPEEFLQVSLTAL